MRKYTEIALTLGVLLFVSVLPAQAWRGHGRHGGLSVAIVPQLVLPVMPSWRPYVYPPAVVVPAPPVYVQPAPPGYYPYVQECPGGWRQANPSSPQPQ
jgi:hypothetical protein